jgi:hypothetical protein
MSNTATATSAVNLSNTARFFEALDDAIFNTGLITVRASTLASFTKAVGRYVAHCEGCDIETPAVITDYEMFEACDAFLVDAERTGYFD